jgi:AcrR family transcriptional regulator
MSNKDEDPRVIRTKALIVDALVSLMQENPYKKVKIQDIAKRAKLARQTFYLHYQTKDDVLLEYINDVFETFYQEIEQHIIASPEPDPIVSWHLFKQWQMHAPFARLVIEADIENLVIKSFKNYIARVMGLYIRNHEVKLKDPEALAFLVDYLAGASWMMLQRWVQQDFKYPLEKIASLYSEITQPGMLNVLNKGGEV